MANTFLAWVLTIVGYIACFAGIILFMVGGNATNFWSAIACFTVCIGLFTLIRKKLGGMPFTNGFARVIANLSSMLVGLLAFVMFFLSWASIYYVWWQSLLGSVIAATIVVTCIRGLIVRGKAALDADKKQAKQ